MSKPDDSLSDSSEPEPQKPRGLWEIMNHSEETSEETVDEVVEESSEEVEGQDETPEEQTEKQTDEQVGEETEAQSEQKPRGLWSLMGGKAAPVESASITEDQNEAEAAAAEEDVVQDDGHQDEIGEEALKEHPPREEREEDEQADSSEENEPEVTVPTSPFAKRVEQPATVSREEVLGKDAAPLPVPESPMNTRAELAAGKRMRMAWWSLVLGCSSIPLAGLAILPELWAKLPAMGFGFLALWLGFAAIGEMRRSQRRLPQKTRPIKTFKGQILAGAGVTASVVGMFLGPMLFSEMGEGFRRESGRGETRDNLQTIGNSLVKFHDERGRFPIGGRFDGDTPMHGWMTTLLPFVGETELFNRIDLNVPYDAAVNRQPMSQDVSVFHAGGSPRTKAGAGFAVTHFSGLGGEEVDEVRGLSDVGIFERNQQVDRNDVVDGLSQTLVAGEIGRAFPPWGDPENWRTIGKGLNKDFRGFGNSDQTGSMFLHADGSVKFYSNAVSREVLINLSTRNGREAISADPGR